MPLTKPNPNGQLYRKRVFSKSLSCLDDEGPSRYHRVTHPPRDIHFISPSTRPRQPSRTPSRPHVTLAPMHPLNIPTVLLTPPDRHPKEQCVTLVKGPYGSEELRAGLRRFGGMNQWDQSPVVDHFLEQFGRYPGRRLTLGSLEILQKVQPLYIKAGEEAEIWDSEDAYGAEVLVAEAATWRHGRVVEVCEVEQKPKRLVGRVGIAGSKQTAPTMRSSPSLPVLLGHKPTSQAISRQHIPNFKFGVDHPATAPQKQRTSSQAEEINSCRSEVYMRAHMDEQQGQLASVGGFVAEDFHETLRRAHLMEFEPVRPVTKKLAIKAHLRRLKAAYYNQRYSMGL